MRSSAGLPVQVYWTKRIDNSRLVRQPDPAATRETAALVGAALVCLGILLVCAWQHFEFIHAGYRLEQIRTRHEQVLEWNRTLRLEQAALLDPMRIDALARNRLGLESPPAGQLVPLGSPRVGAPAPLLAADTVTAQQGPAPRPLHTSIAD